MFRFLSVLCMINFFVNLLAVIILVIIQISFLTTWLFPINSLNLILSLLIFLTIIINYEKALVWALGSGLFLEMFTVLPFGLTTMSLILTVISINFLFNNFFTNRSFYSLMILGLFGTLIYNLLIFLFNILLIIFGFNLFVSDFLINFVWQPILNLVILAVIFFTYYISTKRLRSIFLFHSTSYEIKK